MNSICKIKEILFKICDYDPMFIFFIKENVSLEDISLYYLNLISKKGEKNEYLFVNSDKIPQGIFYNFAFITDKENFVPDNYKIILKYKWGYSYDYENILLSEKVYPKIVENKVIFQGIITRLPLPFFEDYTFLNYNKIVFSLEGDKGIYNSFERNDYTMNIFNREIKYQLKIEKLEIPELDFYLYDYNDIRGLLTMNPMIGKTNINPKFLSGESIFNFFKLN